MSIEADTAAMVRDIEAALARGDHDYLDAGCLSNASVTYHAVTFEEIAEASRRFWDLRIDLLATALAEEGARNLAAAYRPEGVP